MARKTIDEASGETFGYFLARRVHALYHEGQSKASAVELIAQECARAAGRDLADMSGVRRRLVKTHAWGIVGLAYGPEHCGTDHKFPVCAETSPASPASSSQTPAQLAKQIAETIRDEPRG